MLIPKILKSFVFFGYFLQIFNRGIVSFQLLHYL